MQLAKIPGVGVVTATALAATVMDPSIFRSGAGVWGLPGPRAASELLGRQGTARPRLQGATSVIRRARTRNLGPVPWIRSLLERRLVRVVTVAMGNNARID